MGTINIFRNKKTFKNGGNKMKILNRKISIRVLMAVLVITILLVSVVVIFAVSSNFAVPNTFTSGTTISASEMNANFTAIGQQLPYSKTISFGSTTLTASQQNVSGLLTVTPPANGYLILFGNATVSTTDSLAYVNIFASDSTGVALNQDNGGHGEPISGNPYVFNVQYSQGYVTANTPLYFYLGVHNNSVMGGTVQGRLTAVFFPAPNQLP